MNRADPETAGETVRDWLEPEYVRELGDNVPRRHFLDSADLLPMKNVSLLSGDGGTGKTLLALQLAIATACDDGAWLGLGIMHRGPVLFLSAEDDRDECHIRLNDICTSEGISLKELPIAFLHCAGRDVVMAIEDKGRVKATDNFDRLKKACARVKPKLLVLDPSANLFQVNENSRPAAIACVGMLRGLGIDFDCAVLLLSHPSLSGLNSGSGTAGSTSWNNAVRSRLYFTARRPGADDDKDEVDPDMRYLSPKKSNYSKLGETIALRWQDGRFVRADVERPFDGVARLHLDQVRAAFDEGDWRYDDRASDWGGFCAADIIGLDLGKGLAARDLTKAQQKARRKIKTVLSTWLRNEQIGIVERLDPKTRKQFKFFCMKGV